MVAGLAISDVTNVTINIEPLASPFRNFGALCIIGDSNVIDVVERTRQYANLNGLATDFGTTAPEYLAGDLFFSQSPQPAILYVGRWASEATEGLLNGGMFGSNVLVTLLTTLQAISAGSFTITVDGTPQTLTAIDFASPLISNLNGAASVITAKLSGAVCVWDAVNNRFVINSTTTGASSAVLFATNPGSGAQLATILQLTQATGANEVAGQLAETPLAGISACVGNNSDIYGTMFATTATITDTQVLAVAEYIEGSTPTHIFGWNTQEAETLDPTSSTDIGALLAALDLERTFWQYSSSSPYAVASMFGRAFTVDFTANNSTITLMFKQEPGVQAEKLTETQAATLKTKNGNVFALYQNNQAIIQTGVMSNGYFFDEVYGCDWLQNAVQTNVWNLLYQSPTKIPQTDAGVHQIVAVVQSAMEDGVNNALIAPGQWNSSYAFGTLQMGQTLTSGYYVYAPPISSQEQAIREQRIAPTIQCAIKLAGAVHMANVIINVNR